MIRHEGHTLRRVIVTPPGKEYLSVDDLTRHNYSSIPDKDTARHQHAALRQTLSDFGAEVISIEECRGHPNSVFVRDVALLTPEGAVILSMGLPSRKGEEGWIQTAFERLHIPVIECIKPPATIEGGDVILAGDVAFVGRSSRTNNAGVVEISRILRKMDYDVRHAVVPPVSVHIGGMMSMLGPEKILACTGVFPGDFFKGFSVVEVPLSSFSSGNVATLGPDEVIAENSHAETIDTLDKSGIKVHQLGLSAFLAGTGGPSCLILPVVRE